jgi:hypothetical protein
MMEWHYELMYRKKGISPWGSLGCCYGPYSADFGELYPS